MRRIKYFVASALAALSMLASTGAHAVVVTYNSRAAFESALATFAVDSLNGITPFSHSSDLRADFSISTQRMYGCLDHLGCSDNSGIGFDNAYMWTYLESPVTFNFATAVAGFGFDYANPVCCDNGAVPSINGQSSGARAGFFGVISDTALTTFVLTQSQSYLLIDNITYGSGQNVPEPASLALVGLGLIGFSGARRRRTPRP